MAPDDAGRKEPSATRRLLEVERLTLDSGFCGDGIQRVAKPTVTGGGKKAPALSSANPGPRRHYWS